MCGANTGRQYSLQHHRVDTIVTDNKQRQCGEWQTAFQHHQEERPVPMQATQPRFVQNNAERHQNRHTIGDGLAVNEPFDPHRHRCDISPKQDAAQDNHDEPVEHRKHTVGLEHQQGRDVGTQIEQESV